MRRYRSKAAIGATTPASKVERLLDVFRRHPEGIDLTTCSCARRGTLAADSKRGNCQRRFWQHAIRDDADFAAHGLRPFPSGQARRKWSARASLSTLRTSLG